MQTLVYLVVSFWKKPNIHPGPSCLPDARPGGVVGAPLAALRGAPLGLGELWESSEWGRWMGRGSRRFCQVCQGEAFCSFLVILFFFKTCFLNQKWSKRETKFEKIVEFYGTKASRLQLDINDTPSNLLLILGHGLCHNTDLLPEASNELLQRSLSVAGQAVAVSAIGEAEQEKMSDEEHSAFERGSEERACSLFKGDSRFLISAGLGKKTNLGENLFMCLEKVIKSKKNIHANRTDFLNGLLIFRQSQFVFGLWRDVWLHRKLRSGPSKVHGGRRYHEASQQAVFLSSSKFKMFIKIFCTLKLKTILAKGC